MYGADPFGDPPGSMCFGRADGQKNPAPNPVHQRRNDLDVEENCKAAASMLRKIQRALGERRPLSRARRHERLQSNASFETKHRPPAEFPESPSWGQSVAYQICFCENKIARRFGGANWLAACGWNAGAGPVATVLIPLGYAALNRSRERPSRLRRPGWD